ncbi:MAG TPA: SPOR domain-containing protein [Burkholderiales bacterium]|nr:SPOR domain-containing protein [Burkholderiales bacterium]
MRALFFVLVLANLAFFGWHAGYIGPPEQKTGEPERLSQQIVPEKIRLVSADAARRIEAAAAARAACIEWGSFPLQDADRAQAALAQLGVADRVNARKVEEAAQWWVFMPPQGGKTNADKKTDELKRLGITDYFVVTDEGANKWAISLGVFRTEDAARSYLAAISAKGVKTARAGERETRVQKTIFQIRQVDPPLQTRLTAIRKDFPGIDMHPCVADDSAAAAARKS